MKFRIDRITSETNTSTTEDTRNFVLYLNEVRDEPIPPMPSIAPAYGSMVMPVTASEAAQYSVGDEVNVVLGA